MTGSRRPPAPLPRDARAMLATYREAEAMPSEAKDRIWEVVGADDDAPAPAFDPLDADTPEPEPEPERHRGALWIGVGLAAAAALVLAWQAGGSRAERRDPAAPPPSAVMQADDDAAGGHAHEGRASQTKPAPATHSVPLPPPLQSPTSPPPSATATPTERSPEPTSRPKRRTTALITDDPEPATPVTPSSTLAAERALVAKAWRALGQGNTAGALSVAADHAQRFPEGLLAPEREAVQTIARCRRGETDGVARAEAFVRAHPRSPLAGRVDEACRASREK